MQPIHVFKWLKHLLINSTVMLLHFLMLHKGIHAVPGL